MNLSNTIKRMLKAFFASNKSQQNSENETEYISTDLAQNEKTFKEKLGSSEDIMFTKFNVVVEKGEKIDALLIAVDGLVDEDVKRNNILRPLQLQKLEQSPNANLDQVQNILQVENIEVTQDLNDAVDKMLGARILVLVDGHSNGLLIKAPGFESRGIEEPSGELAVRSSHEGFIETNGVNMSLIRRRVIDRNLRFESFILGKLTKTDVKLAYIEGLTDPDLVQRVRDRLKEIKVDALNSDGEIEQIIEDHPYSPFATVGNTERPDKTARLLTEGRIIILTSGSPIVLYGPNLFLENFTYMEDYVSKPFYSSFIRLIRYLTFFLSIYTPALYLTALNFEKNLIPSDIMVPIMQAREQVPFPLVVELLIGIVLFEIIREAGVRLPKTIGSALSIVGALIIGEVAVNAGLIGAPTIIIVSLSFIASFVIIPLAGVIAILRIIFILAASLFGSYGIAMVSLAVLTHMVSLTSFGVPYMAPYSPFYFRDWKDTFIRFPTRLLKKRPKSIPNQKPDYVESLPDTEDKQ